MNEVVSGLLKRKKYRARYIHIYSIYTKRDCALTGLCFWKKYHENKLISFLFLL
jgi:hypothetical protein